MRVRQSLLATGAAAALILGLASAATATTGQASTGSKACGYHENGTDAFYNHCTSDGSHIIIRVAVFGPDYERCVGPGDTWLGRASTIQNANYANRTC